MTKSLPETIPGATGPVHISYRDNPLAKVALLAGDRPTLDRSDTVGISRSDPRRGLGIGDLFETNALEGVIEQRSGPTGGHTLNRGTRSHRAESASHVGLATETPQGVVVTRSCPGREASKRSRATSPGGSRR